MKQTELAHHGTAVIVDALARKPVLRIEGKDTAEREFHASTGCGHSPSPDS
jgi:hypothetical protein